MACVSGGDVPVSDSWSLEEGQDLVGAWPRQVEEGPEHTLAPLGMCARPAILCRVEGLDLQEPLSLPPGECWPHPLAAWVEWASMSVALSGTWAPGSPSALEVYSAVAVVRTSRW